MVSTIVTRFDSDQLAAKAVAGDESAKAQLLIMHRDRLRRMIAVFLDPRVLARVDPSGVVQVTLADASRKLPNYLNDCPGGFYPWLRQIAKDRIVDMHRRHFRAEKRSVEWETVSCLICRSFRV